ncbi:MAG TPA: TIGR02996 domain-containing protein [Gemmataceae bacterium]|nr:TIGR02996 domain-containing protein [Gemmataceae bacterium]
MDSDGAALWRAILDAPHDDAPRVVYADYLEELGRPERAEFIRLQCRLIRDYDPGVNDRINVLWDRFGETWQAELPPSLRRAGFRRGFVYPEFTNVRPVQVTRIGCEVFDAAPLWKLHLRPSTGRAMRKLIGLPGLRSLDYLSVWVGGHLDHFVGLLDCGSLANLSTLVINGDLAAWPVAATTVADGLPMLRDLSVYASAIAPTTIEWLAAAPLNRLELLTFGATHLADVGVARIFAEPRYAQLRELSLHDNRVTAVGLGAVFANPSLSNLSRLTLSQNALGDEGARLLSMWPGLSTVRNLDLAFTDLGPTGASALIASPFLSVIHSINLRATPALRDAATLTRLRARFGNRLIVG